MPHYSNKFILVKFNDQNWNEQWEYLKSISNITDWGIKLFEPLKNNLKCIVVESKYVCKDYRNLYSNYVSKKFRTSIPITNRFHLFNNDDFELDDLIFFPEKLNAHYIGFSIISPMSERCIGRTVIDPFKLNHIKKDSFYCLTTEFKSRINGSEYKIKGYPFISQLTDATVCAHSSIWGLCRFLSERYTIYKEIYPFDIVKMTDSNNGRIFPYRGMTYADYSKILTEFGTFPLIIKLKKEPEDKTIELDKFNDLYSYMESGFPILASLHGHVVTITGHTLDYSKKLNKNNRLTEDFYFSSNYVDNFIVMDDNCFPYQLLGEKKVKDNYSLTMTRERYTFNNIYTAVIPLPEKVFLTARKVRTILKKYLDEKNGFIRKSLKKIDTPPYIVRISLSTSNSFKKSKLKHIKENGSSDALYTIINYFMPHFVWVVEISSIKQYKDKKCCFEMVIDSTTSEEEDTIIYTRIGNNLFYKEKSVTFATENSEFKQFIHNLTNDF